MNSSSLRSLGRAGVAAVLAAATILFAPACSGGGEGGSEGRATSGPEKEGLPHLEGRAGGRGTPRTRAKYKVSREGDRIAKEFKVEVRDAPRGTTYVVTLDGVEVGRVTTDIDGEAQLEVAVGDGGSFPAGFPEPRVDSVVRIGTLAELRLGKLEKLTQLEAAVSGGQLSGKIGFSAERLGGTVTREFKLRIEGAAADSTHTVRIDRVVIGELAIDSDGEGKLEFNEAEGEAFPERFPEPKPGSVIEVGEIFRGELRDRGAGRGG